uniref:Cycloidea-like protein n=1 Tax=Galinsoga parviflora TaxID=176602 RepID=A0A346D3T5_GALPI|nr:cycloidea-like protein [Galinsoga parviflora]
MFSSNPFSQNVFSPPNSFLDNEKDDAHFNYHHQIHMNPYISNDFATLEQDFVLQHQFSEDLLDSVVSSSFNKKLETSKRDGHSKICTAGGLRDRRVRLSIDIARKFFCLQDLLGFDKASNTLDWLLTKSLTSIKDLVEQTNSCSSSTVTDESKAEFLETIKADLEEPNGLKMKSLQLKSVHGKGKKMTHRSKAHVSQETVTREQSRAQARARARERTKAKNLVKKLDDCGQIELHNAFKDTSWECIMDQ